MAHMQLEVEKQKKKKSPVADIVSMKYWWEKKEKKNLHARKLAEDLIKDTYCCHICMSLLSYFILFDLDNYCQHMAI